MHAATELHAKVAEYDRRIVAVGGLPSREPLADQRIAAMTDEVICALPLNRPIAVQIACRIARMVEVEHGIRGA